MERTVWQQMTDMVAEHGKLRAEGSQLKSHEGNRERELAKSILNGRHSPNKALPPNLIQTVPPAGNQIFKHPSLPTGSHSYSKHHSPHTHRNISLIFHQKKLLFATDGNKYRKTTTGQNIKNKGYGAPRTN